MDKTDSENIDKIGILISLLCCIHCVVTPVLLVMAPGIGQYFESALVHVALFALVAPIALFSFINTYRTNGHKRPLIIGIVGLTGLFIGMFIHSFLEHSHAHHAEGLHEVEMAVNIISGLIMITAHALNFRERNCSC